MQEENGLIYNTRTGNYTAAPMATQRRDHTSVTERRLQRREQTGTSAYEDSEDDGFEVTGTPEQTQSNFMEELDDEGEGIVDVRTSGGRKGKKKVKIEREDDNEGGNSSKKGGKKSATPASNDDGESPTPGSEDADDDDDTAKISERKRKRKTPKPKGAGDLALDKTKEGRTGKQRREFIQTMLHNTVNIALGRCDDVVDKTANIKTTENQDLYDAVSMQKELADQVTTGARSSTTARKIPVPLPLQKSKPELFKTGKESPLVKEAYKKLIGETMKHTPNYKAYVAEMASWMKTLNISRDPLPSTTKAPVEVKAQEMATPKTATKDQAKEIADLNKKLSERTEELNAANKLNHELNGKLLAFTQFKEDHPEQYNDWKKKRAAQGEEAKAASDKKIAEAQAEEAAYKEELERRKKAFLEEQKASEEAYRARRADLAAEARKNYDDAQKYKFMAQYDGAGDDPEEHQAFVDKARKISQESSDMLADLRAMVTEVTDMLNDANEEHDQLEHEMTPLRDFANAHRALYKTWHKKAILDAEKKMNAKEQEIAYVTAELNRELQDITDYYEGLLVEDPEDGDFEPTEAADRDYLDNFDTLSQGDSDDDDYDDDGLAEDVRDL